MNPIKQNFTFSDGRTIEVETGKLAKQADGSVVIRMGNTMMLATVVSAKEARDGVDFMPLTVDYREQFASAGKFPGGFLKREARPSDHEILICRLIDRALRPLFPDDYHAETQVLVYLLSSDKDNTPEGLACLAASCALSVSDVPFNGPVSEVRIGKVDGKLIPNPTQEQIANSTLDMIIAGTEKDILMVEGQMSEISESEMIEAIQVAHTEIINQCKMQLELRKAVGITSQREYCHEDSDEELYQAIHKATYQKCYDLAKSGNPSKHERKSGFDAIKKEFTETLTEEEASEKQGFINTYFHKVEKEAMRRSVLDEKIRLDGRKTDQIRPIWCEIDYLPSTHGSAVFTRGETQSLTTVTLGSKLDYKKIDGAYYSGEESFLLHYNFPPFSTGEARFLRGTSRREVGHGNLALRALKPMIPADFPYALRVVSDILESNGSSSMATVCAGTLALMDAGVKIKKPVSGIAMGLITDNEGKYTILSDILGDEDHLGDMDFKVTGTVDGITACQMDMKIDGLSYDVLAEALNQAKAGRHHILGEMMKVMDVPREDYKDHAPRIVQLTIPKDLIGAVIGPGGKIIQQIQADSGATIVIEEINNQGVCDVMGDNKESIDIALKAINAIIKLPEEGEVYMGKVKSVVAFGAFVEIMPGKEGLLHVSEIDWKRIEDVSKVLKEGDQVKVKLLSIDSKTGKFKLSRKVLMPRPERKEAAEDVAKN